jgi:broad specificity phosphatase PhoE
MTLDLYLIRHAESHANHDTGIVGGRQNESPLSPLGERQAAALGKRLAADGIWFDEVYASTAVRAYQTASIACKELGISAITSMDDLLELSQGAFERQPRAAVYTPEVMAQIKADQWEFRPPGGESQRDVEERMLRWVQQHALPKYEDGKRHAIAVFSHGMSIKCLLRGIMGFEPKITYSMVLDNTGIAELRYGKRGWHPIRINDCAHLAGIGKMEPPHVV